MNEHLIQIPGTTYAQYVGLRILFLALFITLCIYLILRWSRFRKSLRRIVEEQGRAALRDSNTQVYIRRSSSALVTVSFLIVLALSAVIVGVTMRNFHSVEIRKDAIILHYYYGRDASIPIRQVSSIEYNRARRGKSANILITSQTGDEFASIGGPIEEGQVQAACTKIRELVFGNGRAE